MKRIFPGVALFVVAGGIAHAQSSVTLYGIVDEAFEAVSNVKTGPGQGKHLFQLNGSAGQTGSRWGLRGQESLGGGINAIFVLENGFDPGTGKLNQGGDEFGRQAYVGLSSSQLGSVTVGRQYDSVVDFLGPLGGAEQWGGNRTSHASDIDNLNNTNRVNNAVKITSKVYGGLKLQALYSFGGVAGSTSRNQIYSFGVGYANGPFSVAAAYLNVRDPNISFFGNNASSGGVAANNFGATNPIFGGYTSAHTYQVAGVGSSYALGAATLGITYTNIQFRGLGNTAEAGPNPNGFTGNAVFNSFEVNGKYQLTPALLLGASYDYTHNSGASSTKSGVNTGSARYNQFSAGTDYFFSRRTDAYLVVSYQIASGFDSTGQAASAELGSIGGSSTGRQAFARVGLRHRF